MQEQMTRRYQLETALYRLEQRLSQVGAALKAAKFTLREAKQAQLLYDGSLKSFFDKLSGKREERQEALRRDVSAAEAQLAALTREEEGLKRNRETIEQEMSPLPAPEELRAWALGSPETAKQWASLEAAFCAEQLQILLEKTDEALEGYRAQLRGDRMGQIVSREELHEIGTAHISLAEACRPLLHRLQEAMEILEQTPKIEVGGYFSNPSGFIVSAAAQHNRIDRVNDALFQVAAARRQIAAISPAEE